MFSKISSAEEFDEKIGEIMKDHYLPNKAKTTLRKRFEKKMKEIE